jgi:hypothetical protein
MTDRLSLTTALADANIDRQKAERIVTDPRAKLPMSVAGVTRGFDAIHDNVATKQDLQQLEAVFKADIAAVKAELKTDMTAVRAEIRELELRVEARIDRVVVLLDSLIVILAGIGLAAIRYLPHA